jgi:hypothetical protein
MVSPPVFHEGTKSIYSWNGLIRGLLNVMSMLHHVFLLEPPSTMYRNSVILDRIVTPQEVGLGGNGFRRGNNPCFITTLLPILPSILDHEINVIITY